jgi:hypothetical protein
MEQARQLRAKADHCIRLSHGINDPADVARVEAMAAEYDRAAAEREAAAAARLAATQTRPD